MSCGVGEATKSWRMSCDVGKATEVLENKVLRMIFGPKRDETTGEWSKLDIAELHALYSSPNTGIGSHVLNEVSRV